MADEQIEKKPLNRELLQTRLVLIAFILVSLTSVIVLGLANLNSGSLVAIKAKANTTTNSPVQTTVFPYQVVLAQAVVVYDINNQKVLFAKNADTVLPLASLTKLMTVLVTAEQIPLKTLVTIPDLNFNLESFNPNLIAGEKWHLKDLIDFTLVSSSNDGARALALVTMAKTQNPEINFVTAMNNRRQSLGLTDLRFYNETGLDESPNLAGAYGSALAISKLNAYLVTKYPELIEATNKKLIYPKISGYQIHPALNTNPIIGNLPGLLSSKTGYTLLAGGNLSIVFQAGLNRPIAITVLGSSLEGRFSDTEKLVWATLDYLAQEEK